MEEYAFEDALVNATVTCSFPGLEAVRSRHGSDAGAGACTSLFFPGCSFVNYGLPLVREVYDLLADAGRVDGLSLLCCGKILEYESDAATVRPAFEQQFRDHIAATSVRRIVTACPNCVESLRKLLAEDERTSGIEVVPLVTELVDLGYRVDAARALDVARRDARLTDAQEVAFCVKDSCPDRETGEFADGLRSIMPEGSWVEPAHARKRSVCCGSRPRAAGKVEAAFTSCALNHAEARDAGADAIVSACMSCTFLLSTFTPDLPVFHYLELLCGQRIAWEGADQYMKLRFLFDSSLGAREFYGLEDQAVSS